MIFSLHPQGICGVEPGPGYDGVSYTLSILCLAHMLVLGFNSREALLAWDARVRYSLGEGQWFDPMCGCCRAKQLLKDVNCEVVKNLKGSAVSQSCC